MKEILDGRYLFLPKDWIIIAYIEKFKTEFHDSALTSSVRATSTTTLKKLHTCFFLLVPLLVPDRCYRRKIHRRQTELIWTDSLKHMQPYL